MYLKYQISQKRQKEKLLKEKEITEIDKDYLCFVTGSKIYDEHVKLTQMNDQAKYARYGQDS